MRAYLQSLCLLLFLFPAAAPSQELIRSIPSDHARLITTDELGNVYLVRQDNGLIRYSADGDSTGNFRSIQNGELQWVDATNPLRVLLYYPNFSKLILLDRMLSVKNDLDLKKLGIFNAQAVGMSADGRIWVYDFVNARLKKIDDQLNVTNTSNDMRQELGEVPRPTALLERDSRVFLCDSSKGIYTFDRFASYLNMLEIKGVQQLQAFGSQLVYREADSLRAYDLRTLNLKTIPLPAQADFIDARIERNRLYLLFTDRLELYRLPGE
ncbi:hypothetical protein [Taibaiella koreensis]|uniref:hypothetical protein n=1 Tax=Taibaiella koreensis TaxID=1268548 RepID=UPI000E59D9C4|nr:hypothetical protein [Taibaiella koreensis]